MILLCLPLIFFKGIAFYFYWWTLNIGMTEMISISLVESVPCNMEHGRVSLLRGVFSAVGTFILLVICIVSSIVIVSKEAEQF